MPLTYPIWADRIGTALYLLGLVALLGGAVI